MALVVHWKLDETSGGLVDATSNLADGTFFNSPALGVPGKFGNAVDFNGSNQYASAVSAGEINGASEWSISYWINAGQAGFSATSTALYWYVSSGNDLIIQHLSNGKINAQFQNAFNPRAQYTDGAVDLSGWVNVILTADMTNEVWTYYVNGVEEPSSNTGVQVFDLPSGSATYYLASAAGASQFTNAALDDVRVYDSVLTQQEIDDIQLGLVPDPGPTPSILPMTLSGFLSAGQSVLPMRLSGLTLAPAASLPMRLESADLADFTGPSIIWSVSVILDGNDISDQIAGEIDIANTETASSLASLVIRPPNGPVDLNAYERKSISITFNVLDSDGIIQSSHRRYTGTTSTANFDPDDGTINIEATTDVQGQLENMGRDAIDLLTPAAIYSPNVFDDSADGWQYARDRLSTIASEIHSNVWGQLVVNPWEAKATPDITLTDAERFNNSLTLTRADLRDLISGVNINLDFRFSRLRHREIDVAFINERGFCDYLNNGWVLPQKDMVRSASDGAEWTRISGIIFDELPDTNPSVCDPPRAWAGGADEFCLGAYWRAGRRWAQTITEEYSLKLFSPDIQQAIGIQESNADYGLESIYDSTDYEANKDFTGPPAGSVFSDKSNDWQLDADNVEVNGRADMDLAQQVALESSKSLILSRARKNRVNVANVYQPLLQLSHTVRVDTPYLVAKGKVYGYNETLNPISGELNMAIEIAISRHDGSGIGSNDPIDPAPVPVQPQEADTGRYYYLGYHVGGEEFSPPDNDDWDGYMTNVNPLGDTAFPGGETYRTRFVVAYPEIEEVARNSSSQPQTAPYELAVPNDELTLSI